MSSKFLLEARTVGPQPEQATYYSEGDTLAEAVAATIERLGEDLEVTRVWMEVPLTELGGEGA